MIKITTPILAFMLAVLALPLFANPKPGGPWKPSAAALKQLMPAPNTSGFTVMCPKGYQYQTTNGPDGMTLFAWVSPPRADSSHGMLMMTQVTIPPDEANKYTLPQILTKFLGGEQRRRNAWSESAPESGTINNVTFCRAYWEGTDKTTGKALGGLMYVALSGNKAYVLASQDTLPENQAALSLAEQSILTFHVK